MFTGLYPGRHGVLMGFRAQNNSMDDALEAGETSLELVALPAVPTLPEHLQRAGYRTFGVAANINVGSELGFDRGFDEFANLHQPRFPGVIDDGHRVFVDHQIGRSFAGIRRNGSRCGPIES